METRRPYTGTVLKLKGLRVVAPPIPGAVGAAKKLVDSKDGEIIFLTDQEFEAFKQFSFLEIVT